MFPCKIYDMVSISLQSKALLVMLSLGKFYKVIEMLYR